MRLVIVLLIIYYSIKKTAYCVNSMSAIRDFISINELKIIYHVVFSSYLTYTCQMCGLSDNQYII